MTRYAILDCETTGLHARRGDRMIELAVVLLDEHLDELGQLDTRLSIDRPVAATHIHGITDADLIGAPQFAEILAELLALLEGATIVAHYARFDITFLESELIRIGRPGRLDCPVIDSRDLAREAGIVGSLAQRNCCDEFGIVNDRPHVAMGDVLATRELLATCIARGVHPTDHTRTWSEVTLRSTPKRARVFGESVVA